VDDVMKLARRLSGALGRKVDPADVEPCGDDYVLWDGRLVPLLRGNVAYVPGVGWHRNGQRLSEQEADRLLPKG
jgi:hypothetical protein